MIRLRSRGTFNKTQKMLKYITSRDYTKNLRKYGEIGVAALASATPVKTGKTASSWAYEIVEDNRKVVIRFTNSNIKNGHNIAILLQYGHGTNNGGYVVGMDYINPAIRPIFMDILRDAWREVTNA